MTPTSNAWRELDIFKRQHPFPTIPCAAVGSLDFHTTTMVLRDDPSSQELGRASFLETISRISFFHPGKLLKNVTGTRRLSEAAIHHGVKTSVLISTDEAADPANVMGATERLGELYVQALDRDAAHG